MFVDAVVVAPDARRLAAKHGRGLPDLGQFQTLGTDLFARGEVTARATGQPLPLAGGPAVVVAEERVPIDRGPSKCRHHVAGHRWSAPVWASRGQDTKWTVDMR